MNIYEREYLSAMVASCGGDLRKAAGKMELHLSTPVPEAGEAGFEATPDIRELPGPRRRTAPLKKPA